MNVICFYNQMLLLNNTYHFYLFLFVQVWRTFKQYLFSYIEDNYWLLLHIVSI